MGKHITKDRYCAGCGKKFASRNRGGDRGWTRFCSNTCRGKHQGYKGGPWASRLRRRYGLEPHEYQELLDKQSGACALCGITPDYDLYVDHCHETKSVRGLLCARCNNIVGVFDQLGSDDVMRFWGYACQEDWERGIRPRVLAR